jgi:cell division protein FtsI/penicillin-binding protein 2
MQPMLVNHLVDHNGNVVAQYAPQMVRQVMSPGTARLMVEALKTVVSPEGTAPDAAMNDYIVAGKTGTAQKAGPGGYLPGKYFASFIGFFPADNPQLCISIVMDDPKEGYYGGQVCGPIFKEIGERCASYLNIPSDKNLQEPNSPPPLAATGVAKSLASARNP